MEIPYKIYLSESEMPRYWYNVRADMQTKPAPLLNPVTGKPMTAGSDCHRPGDECRSGILSDTLPKDGFEFARLIRSGNYRLIRP